MPAGTSTPQQTQNSGQQGAQDVRVSEQPLTPEEIEQLAKKVYELLRQEVRLNR